ncbi:hypothetical protein HDU67_007686 [Dinochytrium kinnereticum]|nr:hypothetical protein HDU67_007686 [Dinochytrium kinnereticum]
MDTPQTTDTTTRQVLLIIVTIVGSGVISVIVFPYIAPLLLQRHAKSRRKTLTTSFSKQALKDLLEMDNPRPPGGGASVGSRSSAAAVPLGMLGGRLATVFEVLVDGGEAVALSFVREARGLWERSVAAVVWGMMKGPYESGSTSHRAVSTISPKLSNDEHQNLLPSSSVQVTSTSLSSPGSLADSPSVRKAKSHSSIVEEESLDRLIVLQRKQQLGKEKSKASKRKQLNHSVVGASLVKPVPAVVREAVVDAGAGADTSFESDPEMPTHKAEGMDVSLPQDSHEASGDEGPLLIKTPTTKTGPRFPSSLSPLSTSSSTLNRNSFTTLDSPTPSSTLLNDRRSSMSLDAISECTVDLLSLSSTSLPTFASTPQTLQDVLELRRKVKALESALSASGIREACAQHQLDQGERERRGLEESNRALAEYAQKSTECLDATRRELETIRSERQEAEQRYESDMMEMRRRLDEAEAEVYRLAKCLEQEKENVTLLKSTSETSTRVIESTISKITPPSCDPIKPEEADAEDLLGFPGLEDEVKTTSLRPTPRDRRPRFRSESESSCTRITFELEAVTELRRRDLIVSIQSRLLRQTTLRAEKLEKELEDVSERMREQERLIAGLCAAGGKGEEGVTGGFKMGDRRAGGIVVPVVVGKQRSVFIAAV